MDDGLNPWTSTDAGLPARGRCCSRRCRPRGRSTSSAGYLAQAFGGLFGRFGPAVGAAVAVVVPAVLFALAHGLGQDLPIFIDRLAFGLVAGALVLLTGGLEAGIAMHVVNNFLAFGLALAFGDMTEALTPTDGTWWSLPVTLTQSLSYLLRRAVGRAARWCPGPDERGHFGGPPRPRVVFPVGPGPSGNRPKQWSMV